jgi:TIR domain-containing protein
MRVFISYAHDDRERMLAIAEAVRAAGHEVDVDEDLLRGGDDFARKIEASIGACDACVVLWSPSAAGKHWVPAEANLALQQRKRVISVKLAACSIPLPFSTFHILDLTGSSELAPLLRSLDPSLPPVREAPRSPWPRRLLGAAVAAALLSAGGWLALPLLRKPPPPPTPEVMDAGPTPAPPPVVVTPAATSPVPDPGPPAAPDAGRPPAPRPRPQGPAADPCATAKARFDQVQASCREPCDLDHYPMREDLDRCRACDELRTQLQRCTR